jgi:hypothetical protein
VVWVVIWKDFEGVLGGPWFYGGVLRGEICLCICWVGKFVLPAW